MIGVLALQGGVVEHFGHLGQLGVESRGVRAPRDLIGLKGLIIPGGESTCLRRLLVQNGMQDAIREAWQGGMWLWGTCAGAILLATTVEGEESCFGLIDIRIRRNAFGSQLDSFNSTALVPGISDEPIPLVFIRAPQITGSGPGVRILLQTAGAIAAAEEGRVLVTVFHPELTPDLAFHRYFARRCGALADGEDKRAGGKKEARSASAATWPRSVTVLDNCARSVGGTPRRSSPSSGARRS